MLTRSELCVHRSTTLKSRIPLCWVLVRSTCELSVHRQKQHKKNQNRIKVSPNVNSLDTVKFVAENVRDSAHSPFMS